MRSFLGSALLGSLCCTAGLPLAAAQAPSEEEELAQVYGDKTTISIATGAPQALRRAPAVATVITAQDIAAMGATGIDEVLESVPGVHVSRSSNSFAPLYLIRGIHSEFNAQTLMLLNGVPLTTLFVGNRGLGWGDMPVENIARIEIIRGPGSALYGADAFSGVINVITKTAADVDGVDLGVRVGSFRSRDGWLQYGGRLGAFDVATYLRVGSTDGQRETVSADQQTALDGAFNTRASLAPAHMNVGFKALDASADLSRDRLRLRASYKLRDDLQTGAGVAGALDPVGRYRIERITSDVSWSDIELGRDWRGTLTASYLHYQQTFNAPLQLFPPGAFGGTFPKGMLGAPSTWERQVRLAAVAHYSGIQGHNLRIGAGHDDLDMYRTREFKNFTIIASGPATGLPVPLPSDQLQEFPPAESFAEPHRRTVSYVYLQDEWRVAKDWTLTAGLRHDHYSDFGSTTNPRAALVWDANLDLTIKLLYGRAFRAPAFTEQYSINNPVIRGNAALKPETISTLEAAFSWQARADTQLNLSLFRYGMKDIIRTTDTGGGTARFNNIGARHGTGLELDAQWDATRKLRLSGNVALQRSIEDATGSDAGYAPRVLLNARADWSLANGWLLGVQANHVADRRRPAGDARAAIADDTTADLTLRTGRGKGRWDFVVSVRNLFNAAAREPSMAPGLALPHDIPLARRSLYVQAAHHL
ncbi:TonB-dependent receptor plug domain-containing protein [Roseateles sp. LYH14W]|uniref:TonB-dependent receptor plug domain-containing protein n=1 Tax=Pelomonas parva TaxID=3299032 RepID=A0ABW7F2Y8_9BURK